MNSQQNPLADRKIRFGLGISGAIIMAFVAFVYLDGLARQLALIVAILDAVITPKILKRAAEQQNKDEPMESVEV